MIKYLKIIFLVLMSFTYSYQVCAYETEASDTTSVIDEVIEVGNKLFINIPNEAEFEHTFEVNNKGQIKLPELGKGLVAGKTLQRAENELKLQ